MHFLFSIAQTVLSLHRSHLTRHCAPSWAGLAVGHRERDYGHPEPPGLTHRQLPFVLTKFLKNKHFHIFNVCFLCCSVWRVAVGSQPADVVLSLWVMSHLHTVTASWLKLCSRISVLSVEGAGVFCIQEWLMMSSKEGRSAGRRDRHHLMSCWHSVGK